MYRRDKYSDFHSALDQSTEQSIVVEMVKGESKQENKVNMWPVLSAWDPYSPRPGGGGVPIGGWGWKVNC